jgi:hypothetical protein
MVCKKVTVEQGSATQARGTCRHDAPTPNLEIAKGEGMDWERDRITPCASRSPHNLGRSLEAFRMRMETVAKAPSVSQHHDQASLRTLLRRLFVSGYTSIFQSSNQTSRVSSICRHHQQLVPDPSRMFLGLKWIRADVLSTSPCSSKRAS